MNKFDLTNKQTHATMLAVYDERMSSSICMQWAAAVSGGEAEEMARWAELESLCHGASLAMAAAGYPELGNAYAMLSDVAGHHKWKGRMAG